MHALHNRIRGLVAAFNTPPVGAAAMLAEMQRRVDDFINRHAEAMDNVNTQIAALKLGGVGGDGSIESRSAGARRAVQNLGKFGRTGRAEDLVEGFNINNAMSIDSDPNGGFTVPDELSSEILKVQRNDSAMRRLARVVSTRSTSFKQPMSVGGTDSGWVGEKQTRSETNTSDIALIDVPAGEIYANPAITRNLLDDSAYDLGAFIVGEIGDEFTAQEGAAFISGNGINKPRGFLDYDAVSTADASRAFGKLQYVATGDANGFIALDVNAGHFPGDCLIDLVYALKAKYRQNGTWLMNSATAAKVRKFKDGEGRYLWVDGLAAGQPDRLLGYPVEIDEDMSDTGANAYPIAFGDWQRGYLITDRVGVRILRDELTHKPFIHFYTTKRVGGGLLDSNAIKLLKCAAS